MLQLVQSSAVRPAGAHFSGFVSSGMETAKSEKFVAYRDGGLKGRMQARLLTTRIAKVEGRVLLAWTS
jgi:hypothetical protein